MEEQAEDQRIRLVLVGDQALFRASLGRFLATQSGLEVVGECGTAEAIEVLGGSTAGIVLLDSDLRTECGGEFISASRRGGYKGRFLIVNDVAGAKELSDAIKLGASGIFLKSEAPERLVQAIRLVASGAVWVDRKAIQLLADQVADQPRLGDKSHRNVLTEREEKVLRGVLDGLTNRKIGDNIGLTESAVKSVVQQLFTRAGVRTRGQLVRMALEGGLSVASSPSAG
jgi:DNA-binding NarL/FixJ family response regulator